MNLYIVSFQAVLVAVLVHFSNEVGKVIIYLFYIVEEEVTELKNKHSHDAYYIRNLFQHIRYSKKDTISVSRRGRQRVKDLRRRKLI